jgi:hypothetical protein
VAGPASEGLGSANSRKIDAMSASAMMIDNRGIAMKLTPVLAFIVA